MTSGSDTGGPSGAARRLRQLLRDRAGYRQRWQRWSARSAGADVNAAAVAQVLAYYLWDVGEVADTEVDLPRRLKDRVGRALNGEVLSAQTLRWFIEAFGMSEDDARELRGALNGAGTQPWAVTGRLRAPPDSASPAHRTRLLHEDHWLGPDGLPARHRTVQVIEALVDGLASYPYRYDTDAVEVSVVRGGHAAAPRPDGALTRTDIVFPQPLRRGQTVLFEYRTVFRYATPPPPEFRRATYRRVDNLVIRVEFHPAKLPRAVYWAVWPTLEGDPRELTEVMLDADRAVHRYLDFLTRAAVGFVWQW